MKIQNSYHFGALVILLLAVLIASFSSPLPSAVDANAAQDQFSSARAMTHLAKIAAQPRPPGSKAHDQAFDYLVSSVSAMGLEHDIQDKVATRSFFRNQDLMKVRNLVVRIPGSDGKKAVLFTCHYDTAPNVAAAGKSGMPVAAFLETLRVLKNGEAPLNDLIFLFADGGEVSSFGAEVFKKQHEWAKKVQLVFAFEGRGPNGPVQIVESTHANQWLVSQLRRELPDVVVDSAVLELGAMFYEYSNFTIFREESEAQGLQFSNRPSPNYDGTPLDNLASVDEGTLQHFGSYSLACARRFGKLDLTQIPEESGVFMTLPLMGTLHYQSGMAILLSGLACVLLLACLVMGIRNKSLSIKGTALSMFGFIACLLVTGLFTMLAWQGMQLFMPNADELIMGHPYYDQWHRVGQILTAAGVTGLVFRLLQGFTKPMELTLGAFVFIVLAAIATSLVAPNFSHVFVVPLLFALVAGLIVIVGGSLDEGRRVLITALFAVPGILLWLPSIGKIYNELAGVFMPVFGVLTALMMALVIYPWQTIFAKKAWMPALALVGLGVLTLGVTGMKNMEPTPDSPNQNSLIYVMNRDTAEQHWVSTDPQPDAWTSQVLKGELSHGKLKDFFSPADYPVISTPAPPVEVLDTVVEVIEDFVEGERRILELYISSPSGAGALRMFFSGAKIQAAYSEDEYVGGETERIFAFGLAEKGITMRLELEPGVPLKVKLVEIGAGLPNTLGLQPRAREMTPSTLYNWFQDATVVIKTIEL